jgi:phage shock protein B
MLPGGVIGILIVVFGFAAFCVVVDAIVKMKKMRIEQGKASGPLSNDEARDIQELHRGFEELNKRIEALETILLDRVRKG